jgi:hypothetical protein
MADNPKSGRQAAEGGGFVSRLVADPAHPPDVAALAGYPGASSLDGHVRLYLSVDLSESVDIPEDAVLLRQPVADDPLGMAYLWIRRDAELTRKGRGQAASKARFLSGEIQRDYLSGGQPGAPVAGPTGIQYCTWAPAYCGNR